MGGNGGEKGRGRRGFAKYTHLTSRKDVCLVSLPLWLCRCGSAAVTTTTHTPPPLLLFHSLR